MFSTVKHYLIAAGAALVAGLLILLKVLTFQNKKLKEENKGHVKKEEIREEVAKEEEKIEEEKDEAIKDNDGSDYDKYI